MDTKDLNGHAPEEQSGAPGDYTGNMDSKADKNNDGEKDGSGNKTESKPDTSPESIKESSVSQPGSKPGSSGKDEPVEDAGAGKPESVEDAGAGKTEPVEDAGAGKTESVEDAGAGKTESVEDAGAGKTEPVEDAGAGKTESVEDAGAGKDEPDDIVEKAVPEPSDFQNLEKVELLKVLEDILESKPAYAIRDHVEAIKVSFYKRHKAELELKRKRFMQEGGNAEDFEPGVDPDEIRFKELYRKYRHSKADHNRSMEQTKHVNLAEKMKVIDDLKELVNRNEDINLTFKEFRKLQKRWHEIGPVPQQNLKDLWNTYHHYVETFYDHIKINKELRDLDLKKNLETKIELCEKAEELLLETNIINAFRQLQKYHDQWRETGPVPRDQKDVLWERFREVTHKINKKHQDHFDQLKQAHKKNLEAKALLCEKAESISEKPFESFQQAEKLTKEIVGLQRTWKTIGFAPKKDNTRIYKRFRSACDKFFAKKREYSAQNKELLNENLQKKLDLCIQAETLKDSTDWKRTTDQLITLQQRWKETGPVPRKHYDPVWKRFRAACDHFFNKKSEFFSTLDSKYEENLKKKIDIIEKIENLEPGGNPESNLNILKEYQREWASIGFVPIKEKENIQQRYRAALDKHFESLKIDDSKKNLMKFRHKLAGVKEKPSAFNKLRFEREKFLNRFKQLENDITLWENNIGFFAKSKSAEATIKEFQEKIEQGKKQMELLEEKIRMIDEMDND